MVFVVVSMALSAPGCRKSAASPSEVKAARKVAAAYLDAWLKDRWKRMFELSTGHRIEHLTGIDPRKGSDFARRALERFALVAEQAKRYMGYERFEIQKVAGSQRNLVVFAVKARSEDGRVSEFLLRVVRTSGSWRVD